MVLTAGLGEMGGAQAQAITLNEGVGVLIEVDRWRVERRLKRRQLDVATHSIEEAMTWADEARASGEAKRIGLIGIAAAAWCLTMAITCASAQRMPVFLTRLIAPALSRPISDHCFAKERGQPSDCGGWHARGRATAAACADQRPGTAPAKSLDKP